MKIYTRTGDDGTTGLFYGGRVPKDSDLPTAYGCVDEAQACIGLARAEAGADSELGGLLLGIGRDLYVVMAELATAVENRHKLVDDVSRSSAVMVEAIEPMIDSITDRFIMPTEFVVPGATRLGALLDVARTVVRRAERACLVAVSDGSHAVPYLNRLSDLLWAMARWQDGEAEIAKNVPRRGPSTGSEPS